MSAVNPWDEDKPWDRSSSWVGCRPYTSIVNQHISGRPDQVWYEYIIERYDLTRDSESKSVLILGSSEGAVAQSLCEHGFKGRIVATDIAERALSRSAQRCRERGFLNVEHVVADLNKDRFTDTFDYIVAEGVLHHIEQLAFCLGNLKNCLRPGGYLFAMEFVGAFRFQFPEIQQEWINAALSIMPRKYRPIDPDALGNFPIHPKERERIYYVTPSPESIEAMDPSEALTGFKLPELLETMFKVIEKKPAGGSLVMNMGGHIPFDLPNTDPNCAAWIRILADIEKTLSDQGIVPSDLVFYALTS